MTLVFLSLERTSYSGTLVLITCSHRIIICVRWSTAGQLDRSDTQRPYIYFVIVRLVLQNFGCHPTRCSNKWLAHSCLVTCWTTEHGWLNPCNRRRWRHIQVAAAASTDILTRTCIVLNWASYQMNGWFISWRWQHSQRRYLMFIIVAVVMTGASAPLINSGDARAAAMHKRQWRQLKHLKRVALCFTGTIVRLHHGMM